MRDDGMRDEGGRDEGRSGGEGEGDGVSRGRDGKEDSSNWKQAIVVPIPKGKKKRVVSNIRPISLLPTPGKIFEKIIHRKMYCYLQENCLLTPMQSGFRKNYGIYDPIIDLLNFINIKFNENKFVLCVYVDMAKAFNSIECHKLLVKLEKNWL